jgi:hypothetical protein
MFATLMESHPFAKSAKGWGTRHMHEASKCDLIICWRHNWAECPLEVLELRKFAGTTN